MSYWKGNVKFLARDSTHACYIICYHQSVHHTISQKRSKTVENRIMQPQSSPIPLILWCKFNPEILMGSSWAGVSNKGGIGKTSYLLALHINTSKTIRDTTKLYY